MEWDTNLKRLVGQIVRAVWIEPGEEGIYFQTDRGWECWDTEGDCCSETWFADVYGVEHLIDQVVIETETLDLPDEKPERTRQEFDRVYGIALRTAAGIATLAFRNSSNGYYGGGIAYAGQVAPPPDATRITGDWSA